MQAHSAQSIFAAEETLLTFKNYMTMKNLKKIMLIALIALMMIPVQAAAQVRKPKAQMEKRDKREKRNPVMLRAMRDNDFSMVYRVVKNTSFDKNKIDIIRVACIGSNFSSNQCAKLLSLLSFDDNKLEALEVMAPKVVDDRDYNKIMKQFSFKSSREKAAKILMKR